MSIQQNQNKELNFMYFSDIWEWSKNFMIRKHCMHFRSWQSRHNVHSLKWSGINKCQAVLGNMETLIIKFFCLMNPQSSWEDRFVNRFSPTCVGRQKRCIAPPEWRCCLRLHRGGGDSLWQWHDFLQGKEEKKYLQWK